MHRDNGLIGVKDGSFSVSQGEILGIAGVAGNGQVELVEALSGMRPVAGGDVFIDGQQTANASVRKLIDLGLGYIPPKPKKTPWHRVCRWWTICCLGGMTLVYGGTACVGRKLV